MLVPQQVVFEVTNWDVVHLSAPGLGSIPLPRFVSTMEMHCLAPHRKTLLELSVATNSDGFSMAKLLLEKLGKCPSQWSARQTIAPERKFAGDRPRGHWHPVFFDVCFWGQATDVSVAEMGRKAEICLN